MDESIRFPVREGLADIAQLKGGLADLRAEQVKTKASGQNMFGAEGALKEAQAVDALKNKYAQIVQAGNTLRTALKNAYDPRIISVYTKELAKLDVAQKKIETGAKAAGVSIKNIGKEGSLAAEVVGQAFGAISKATVIVAIIQGVYELAKAGISLASNYEKARKQFEGFLGSAAAADQTLGVLMDTAARNFLDVADVNTAGKALLAFGEQAGNLSGVLDRVADISAATGKNFNELATIYGKARTQGVLFAEDINQLTDAGIPIIQEFAKQLGVSTEQVKKLASEGKISFEELQLAFFNLTAEGGKFSNQAQAQADTLPGLWQITVSRIKPYLKDLGVELSNLAKYTLETLNLYLNALGIAGNTTDKATRATEGSIKRLQKARDEALLASQIDNNVTTRSRLESADKALYDEQRDLNEQIKDQLEDRTKLEDEAEAKRLELAKKNNKAAKAERDKRLKEQEDYNRRLKELELQKLDPDSEAFAVAKEKLRFDDQLAEFRKFNLSTREIEVLHQAALLDIRFDFDQKRRDQEEQTAKFFADLYEKGLLSTKTAQDDAVKELQRQRDLSNERIDIQQTEGQTLIAILQKNGAKEATIKEAERQLDLVTQRARLENELSFQEKLLSITDANDTKRIDEIVVNIQKVQAAIKGIDADLPANPTTDKKEKKKKTSILEDFGFDTDQIAAIEQIRDSVVSALQDIAQARIDEADAALEAAEKKTDMAQAAYDKEKELADQGYANNLETTAAELQNAKDKEAQALKIKQDAQRKQLQLDSAIQLSSLITSSANIYKSLSPLGPPGIVLAAVTIAAMLAAFIAAKSRAANAIKFREGGQVDEHGVMRGPSHERGGVGFEMEGGEFVHTDGRKLSIVNKRSTQKEFSLLSAINRNDEAAKDRWALNRVAVLNRGVPGAGSGSVQVIGGNDKQAHSLLRQIRDKKNAETQTWVENGYRITRRGSHTERVKLKSQ